MVFATGQPQAMELTVTNDGSVAAPSGTTVHVVATPSGSQRLQAVGLRAGAATPAPVTSCPRIARCAASRTSRGRSRRRPVSLPVTVDAATDPGEVTWQVGAAQERGKAADHLTATTVETIADGPLLVADVVAASPLYQGGTGEITVVTGTTAHRPRPVGWSCSPCRATSPWARSLSSQWTCLDTTLTGAAATSRARSTESSRPAPPHHRSASRSPLATASGT